MICLGALAGLAGVADARAQTDSASAAITGTVLDEQDAAVVGATAVAIDRARGFSWSAVSNGSGVYRLAPLAPGTYDVRVSSPGFETRVVEALELTVGQAVILDVRLRVGGITDEIVVVASASPAEPARTQQANTIARVQIEHLPNVGRDFWTYAYTLPGVTDSEAPRAQNPGFTFNTTRFSIGGNNGRNNLVTVDGGENEYGSGALRANLSPEVIEEFQVNRSSFAAEFGFTSGTAVNVVTRSGGNTPHGAVYAFYRSNLTSARNAFDRAGPEAFEQRIVPGGSGSGPLVRDRAFVFTAYEYQKTDAARFRRYAANIEVSGPTTNPLAPVNLRAQAAYLAALDAAPDPQLRRIAAVLRGALTTTNFPQTLALLQANSGTFDAADRRHLWTSRIDVQAGPRSSVMGRFSLFRSDIDLLVGDSRTAPSASGRLPYGDYTGLFSWSRSIGTSALNQLRVQLSPRNSTKIVPNAPESTALSIQGVGEFGRNFGMPFLLFQDRYQLEDTLAATRGRHTLKAGASWRAVRYRIVNELWFGGEWIFASDVYPVILALPPGDQALVAAFNVTAIDPATGAPYGVTGPAAASLTALQAFNLGLPFLFRQGVNRAEWRDWGQYIGLFVQDSWRATDRVTVDAGLRVDLDRGPAPLAPRTYVSPRLGVAWSLDAAQRTVLRAGGGLFYSPVFYQVPYVASLLDDSGRYINQVFATPFDGPRAPPVLWAAGVAAGTLPARALSESDLRALGFSLTRGAPGRVLAELDRGFHNPYTAQLSLGVSRAVGDATRVDLAYQMYRGVHQGLPIESNYREAGPVDPLVGPVLVPIDPTIVQRNVFQSAGRSRYHAVIVSVTRRFVKRIQLQAHYTLGRAKDDFTDLDLAFSPFVPTRLDLDWAHSVFDVRHALTASAVVQLPDSPGPGGPWLARMFGGLTISPVLLARSALPFTLRIGRDVNGDTHGLYDRPFAAERNSGRGAAYASVDVRIVKALRATRRGPRVEIAAEAANLLNRVNYLSVNDVIGLDPALVRGPFDRRGDRDVPPDVPLGFTSAAAGRQVQVSARVAF